MNNDPSIYEAPLASWRTLHGMTAVLFVSRLNDEGEASEFLIVLDGSIELFTDSLFNAPMVVAEAGY